MRTKSDFPKLASPAVLSPMAGVTDAAFRTVARRYGAGLTYTEFVSSAALVRGSKRTLEMLRTDPIEKPVAVQLFGSSVDEVVVAAQTIADGFDIIDVNCGCPVWKVIRSGAGSAMLRRPGQISNFISRLADAVSKPVTVKIRIGIDAQTINAVEVARLVEDAGAAAIAVHGRTQEQGYAGQADWEIIRRVKQAVSIPVIGNGDVFTPEVFAQRLAESGVDAIMIARGALGNPGIFRQINQYLKTGAYEPEDRIARFFEYLELAQQYGVPFGNVKGHAMAFTKGLRDGAGLRDRLARAQSHEEFLGILQPFATQLSR
ncbi:MAG: tRNA dihydrouridine synthase DusB [Candidatus Aenigmarchaeota archaeon]|nr:tRNA dihydrouridine synthase DusB [Candidatus Aenigmarchaeota archaeon]